MNQIENLWRHVKMQFALNSMLPKNAQELWARFQDVWSSISYGYCRKLIKSMSKRINSLIKAKGGHTKY